MTKTKMVTIKRTIGNIITRVETKCYEVGINEMELALRKKFDGQDEKMIREELIKNSRW